MSSLRKFITTRITVLRDKNFEYFNDKRFVCTDATDVYSLKTIYFPTRPTQLSIVGTGRLRSPHYYFTRKPRVYYTLHFDELKYFLVLPARPQYGRPFFLISTTVRLLNITWRSGKTAFEEGETIRRQNRVSICFSIFCFSYKKKKKNVITKKKNKNKPSCS